MDTDKDKQIHPHDKQQEFLNSLKKTLRYEMMEVEKSIPFILFITIKLSAIKRKPAKKVKKKKSKREKEGDHFKS